MGEIIDLESFRRKRKRRAQDSGQAARAGQPRDGTKQLPAPPSGERGGAGPDDPVPGTRIDPPDNKTGK